jgi:hypothetical protein
MSVEYTDFIDNTRRSNCCGAPELNWEFCYQCREHSVFDRQCENFDRCENWIKYDAYLDDECQECENEWHRKNPHPLDVAEREEREAAGFGLEPPPWRGEF